MLGNQRHFVNLVCSKHEGQNPWFWTGRFCNVL